MDFDGGFRTNSHAMAAGDATENRFSGRMGLAIQQLQAEITANTHTLTTAITFFYDYRDPAGFLRS